MTGPDAATIAAWRAIENYLYPCRADSLGSARAAVKAARPLIVAEAREDERQRIVAVVIKVHRKSDLGGLHCVNCGFQWPCPTIQALQSAELLEATS